MVAFALFQNLEVTDPARMGEYAERVRPVTESFGGRYVARGGQVDLIEGDWIPAWPVIIEFPSLAAVHRWYDSDEYAPLKALRESAGVFSAVFIEGVDAPDGQSER